MRRIVLKVIVRKSGNAIPLTLEQHRMAPCISVISREYEEKLFEIEFKPSKGVTDEDVALVHIDALKAKYFILKWEILREYNRVEKKR